MRPRHNEGLGYLHSYIGREITCNQYLIDVIVNMDETNVDYSMSLFYMLEDKGE